jgi:hypothetical protein
MCPEIIPLLLYQGKSLDDMVLSHSNRLDAGRPGSAQIEAFASHGKQSADSLRMQPSMSHTIVQVLRTKQNVARPFPSCSTRVV